MDAESIIDKDIHCANTSGKPFMLRKIPSMASKAKPLSLKMMDEDMAAAGVEGLLKRMGLKMSIGSIVRKCYQIGGTLVSVVLNGLPIAFAVLQDKRVGKNAMMEIGNLVGGLIGEGIGGLVAGALSGIVVPLVIEVGGMIGLGVTEVVAGTIVGAAFGGVGAIIGACVGGLVAVGVHYLVLYIKRKLQEDTPVCRDKALCGDTLPCKRDLEEKEFPKSRFCHLDVQWEKKINTKRELEKSTFVCQQQAYLKRQLEPCFIKARLELQQ